MTDTLDELVIALRHAATGLVRGNVRHMDKVLTQIVASASETVPGADGVAISRTERGSVPACHATDEAIRELELLLVDLRQGPSWLTTDDRPPCGVLVAHDLASQPDRDRWPTVAPAAVRAGYCSMMSAHLTVNGRGRRAALNLYAHQPDVFTDQARTIAALFATQASLLLRGAEQVAYLQRAVDSRDVIGQAKGIIMERFGVDADQAFQMLIGSSQDTNMKLVDVAWWLTHEQATTPDATTSTPL